MKKILKITKNPSDNFFLIAGPCLIEDELSIFKIGETLKKICDNLDIPLILKGSFLKANRTKISSFSGIGDIKALKILNKVGKYLNIPTLTDVHETSDMKFVPEYVDIIQIPAFLCRQTKLIQSAAETNKIINIKKGQFLAPMDMVNVTKKVSDSGNNKILLTERGVSFGYNTLVSDMKSLHVMKEEIGFPVVFDATHSVQSPGGKGDRSGGDRKYVPTLAKAAVAVGVSSVFMETHNNPDVAPSDGPNMVKLEELEKLVSKLIQIDNLVKEN